MDKKTRKKLRSVMKSASVVGREFGKLSRQIAPENDQAVSRKLAYSIQLYKDFFSTLKDLNKSL